MLKQDDPEKSEKIMLRSHSEVYPGLERRLLDRVLPQREDESRPAD